MGEVVHNVPHLIVRAQFYLKFIKKRKNRFLLVKCSLSFIDISQILLVAFKGQIVSVCENIVIIKVVETAESLYDLYFLRHFLNPFLNCISFGIDFFNHFMFKSNQFILFVCDGD